MPNSRTRKEDLLTALNLIENDLSSAHKIVQAYDGDAVADAIHAIIHRREGDFGNSIYWWNRVGRSIPDELADAYPDSDPIAFVGTARLSGRTDPKVADVETSEIQVLKKITDGLADN